MLLIFTYTLIWLFYLIPTLVNLDQFDEHMIELLQIIMFFQYLVFWIISVLKQKVSMLLPMMLYLPLTYSQSSWCPASFSYYWLIEIVLFPPIQHSYSKLTWFIKYCSSIIRTENSIELGSVIAVLFCLKFIQYNVFFYVCVNLSEPITNIIIEFDILFLFSSIMWFLLFFLNSFEKNKVIFCLHSKEFLT